MEPPEIIQLRPAGIFAFIKIFPMVICAIGFLLMSWRFFPSLIWLSLISTLLAGYRFIYIRNIRYEISAEVILVTRGIFLKRVDQVGPFLVEDYVLTQPFLLQLFRLMELDLKSTKPMSPVIWLNGLPYFDLADTIHTRVRQARQ